MQEMSLLNSAFISHNMKNILLLSHIYPGAGVPDTFTPVVHYFAKEWVKMGYNVKVVSLWTVFPSIFYHVPMFARRIASKKFACPLPIKRLPNRTLYTLDGVEVLRLPVFKLFPSSKNEKKTIANLCLSIQKWLDETVFTPDIIVSHWANPAICISQTLKERYGVPTALTLHDSGKGIKKETNWKKLIASIDLWGFRSEEIKRSFTSQFGNVERCFICRSGVPFYYTQNGPQRDFSRIGRFVFVGYLLQRKYPDVVIDALTAVYRNNSFSYNIVGDGELAPLLKKKIQREKLESKVSLLGRLKRNDIIPILDNSDVFIMISKNEVFGLVYLEAMARGCIVVASRGEGMQGVIEDGVDGFFCRAGDAEDLKQVIERIRSLTPQELKNISANAIKKASLYTDYEVARLYANELESLTNN